MLKLVIICKIVKQKLLVNLDLESYLINKLKIIETWELNCNERQKLSVQLKNHKSKYWFKKCHVSLIFICSDFNWQKRGLELNYQMQYLFA